MSTDKNQSTNKTEDTDKIQKNQIPMFQNGTLMKEEEIEQILKMEEGVEALEDNEEQRHGNPKLSPPHPTINEKEDEPFIVKDMDDNESEDGIEEEIFTKDEYIKIANDKINKLQNVIIKLRKLQEDDHDYIQALEDDIAIYEAPKRRIQQLENQIDNVRHQYLNLSTQFRNAETTYQERATAYDSMKEKFLNYIHKINNEKKELVTKIEEKDKENQALLQMIAHLQASQAATTLPLSSQNVEKSLLTNTQTTITDESMDTSNGPPTPATPGSNNNNNVIEKKY